MYQIGSYRYNAPAAAVLNDCSSISRLHVAFTGEYPFCCKHYARSATPFQRLYLNTCALRGRWLVYGRCTLDTGVHYDTINRHPYAALPENVHPRRKIAEIPQ
jgi:hypothetical protein